MAWRVGLDRGKAGREAGEEALGGRGLGVERDIRRMGRTEKFKGDGGGEGWPAFIKNVERVAEACESGILEVWYEPTKGKEEGTNTCVE